MKKILLLTSTILLSGCFGDTSSEESLDSEFQNILNKTYNPIGVYIEVSECTKPGGEGSMLTSTCNTKVDVRTLVPISCTMTSRSSGEVVMEGLSNPENPCSVQSCSSADFVKVGSNWKVITPPFAVSSFMDHLIFKTKSKEDAMNFSKTYKTKCVVVDHNEIP